MNELLKGTSFDGTFQQKLGSILTFVDNASGLYADFKNSSTQHVLNRLVGEDKIKDLFCIGDYISHDGLMTIPKPRKVNTIHKECISTDETTARKHSVITFRPRMTMPFCMETIGIG